MAHFAALQCLNCTWAIQLLLVSFQVGLEKEGSAVVVFYEQWAIIESCGQISFLFAIHNTIAFL